MFLPPLITNPHLYDYIHDLRFADDGTVELVDGAGQLLTTRARGTYTAREVGGLLTITFADLVEVDPYDDERPLRTIPDFAARCTRETGRFPFREGVPWRVKDPEAWPCLLYIERYVFERDPLDFAADAQAGNLYYAAEPPATLDHARTSARIYYPRDSRRALPLRDLRARGIGDGDWLDGGEA